MERSRYVINTFTFLIGQFLNDIAHSFSQLSDTLLANNRSGSWFGTSLCLTHSKWNKLKFLLVDFVVKLLIVLKLIHIKSFVGLL